MIRLLVAVMLIVTLTWCEINARENDVAGDKKRNTVETKAENYLFEKTNKNHDTTRNRPDRSISISVDGSSNTGGCIGDCCRHDDECEGEHVKCDLDQNICRCEEGLLLEQDGNCVNCSDVDFESYRQTCPGVCGECENVTCKPYCKDKQYDIILIIDGSASVGPINYDLQRYHLIQFVSQFNISPHGTRLGYIPYSTDVYNAFNLSDPNVNTTIRVIGHLHHDGYVSGFTNIISPLVLAKDMLESSGNRPDVPNEVIVITDTMATNISTFEQEALALKNTPDTTVSFIGMGDIINYDWAHAIASGPDDIYNGTYQSMTALTVDLIAKLCG